MEAKWESNGEGCAPYTVSRGRGKSRDELGVMYRQSDRDRMIACVNALAGLDPAGVAGVVEFIQRWSAVIDTGHNEGWAQEFLDEARAALAALRGAR